MAGRKVTKVPRFKSEAEEAKWWDSHPEFVSEVFRTAAKEGKLLRRVPELDGMTIRIPIKDAVTARHLAARKGLSGETYVQRLVRQALRQERLTAGAPRVIAS